MIIYRYVCGNLIKTSLALTLALTLLILFNRFAFYIDDAAEGKIPSDLVIVLLVNRLPELLALILPLTLVISILMTYEQLFMNNEIATIHACGMSRGTLFSAIFVSALLLIGVIATITFFASSYGIKNINNHVEEIKQKQFEFLPESSFFNLGALNIYIDSIDRVNKQFSGIFIVEDNSAVVNGGKANNYEALTIAQSGTFEERDDKTYLILNKGQRVQKQTKTGEQIIVDFEHYGQHIPTIDRSIRVFDYALTLNIFQLFRHISDNNATPAIKAQFYWNISVPLMTIILCWIAFSLCNDQPRSARFRELLPMILIFAAYFILLKTVKDNVEVGSATILSFIFVHLAFTSLATILTARRSLILLKYIR